MKKIKVITFAWLLLVLSACNFVQVEEEQILSLDVDGIDQFVVDHDQGELTIIGEENRETIDVEATFAVTAETEEAATEFRESYMVISLVQEENTAVLTSNVMASKVDTNVGRVHVTAYVPKALALDLKNNYGNVEISNVSKGIVINDGVGDVSLSDISGSMKVSDGEGSITIARVNGNLEINTNQGLLEINEVTGDVRIFAGSGDIDVSSIDGSVFVQSGSGSVVVRNVEYDLTIYDNRSGDVGYENIKGEVIQSVTN